MEPKKLKKPEKALEVKKKVKKLFMTKKNKAFDKNERVEKVKNKPIYK